VARWRTRAAVAAVVLVAGAAVVAVVVHASGSDTPSARIETNEKNAGSRARVEPVGQGPLRVRGTSFLPGELVRVALSGQTKKSRSVTADGRGSFRVLFRNVSSCDSVTVTATGSQGSRAGFNLSSYVCAAPDS
jgi:hypothetical protein